MNLRNLLDCLYLTRARAIALGFTHEGSLFGVPAWLIGEDDEMLFGCPKVPALQLWALVADLAYECATWFMFTDQVLEAPVYVYGPISTEVAP